MYLNNELEADSFYKVLINRKRHIDFLIKIFRCDLITIKLHKARKLFNLFRIET